MNDLDNQADFGFALEVSGEGRGQTHPAEDYMKEYLNVYIANGGLFDQVQAAKLAGVSKQHISHLIKMGKLKTVDFKLRVPGGEMLIEQTITGNALRAWMESPKLKSGRPSRGVREPELQAA